MTVNTGTARGSALFGTAAVVAVAAGGVGVLWVPVRDVALAGLWPLAGWFVLAGVAWWCAELALNRSAVAPGGAGDLRTRRLATAALLATVLVAELTMLGARFARAHEYAAAWASGGVFLALIAGASWRIFALNNGMRGWSSPVPSDSVPAIVAFGLAEACGGWLTARFAVEGPLSAAWVLGCAMVVLAGSFWLSRSWGASSTYLKVFGSAALLGVVGVVARSVVRGEAAASWSVGGAAAGIALLVVLVPALSELRWPRVGRGATAPPGAQLAGVLMPLGSLVWATWSGEPWSGPESGDRLVEAGWLAMAAAGLLAAQYVMLLWTNTAPSADRASGLAGVVRRTPPGRRSPVPDDLTRLTVLQRLTSPLQSTALINLLRRTALTTGLAVDDIWPRIALVVPDEVGRRIRRGERSVLICRITVASALCTTGVWLLVALAGLGGIDVERGVAVLPVAGPLAVAAAALAQARRSLVEVYEAKADAVGVYRYDLAKRMHLSVPEKPSGADTRRLAAELSGDRDPDLHEERGTAGLGAGDRARPDEFAFAVASMVSMDLRSMVLQSVRDELSSPTARNPAVGAPLTESQLALLAQEIARATAQPLGTRLERHLSVLQRKFHEEMRSAIRTSLTEAVTGPVLTNFVGYFAVELEDSDARDVRAEGGTIRAPSGRRLRLLASLVRDEQMREFPSVVASRQGSTFFVVEPVRVEGGRSAATASFDVMADSPTLTPLPQRKNLRVEHKQQTAFVVQVPEEGNHEIWLQLYQAGHLVQVVALKIEATVEG